MSFKVSNAFESYIARNCGLWYSDSVGMNSFRELKAWRDSYGLAAPMPVYKPTWQEVEDSVFNTAAGFQGFQAWHDRRHLTYNRGFTLAGEQFLARQHFEELRREGVDYEDAIAVYHLIYSRNVFYHNNGQQAVQGVSQFITEALKCGTDHAARDRRVEAQTKCECGSGYVIS